MHLPHELDLIKCYLSMIHLSWNSMYSIFWDSTFALGFQFLQWELGLKLWDLVVAMVSWLLGVLLENYLYESLFSEARDLEYMIYLWWCHGEFWWRMDFYMLFDFEIVELVLCLFVWKICMTKVVSWFIVILGIWWKIGWGITKD